MGLLGPAHLSARHGCRGRDDSPKQRGDRCGSFSAFPAWNSDQYSNLRKLLRGRDRYATDSVSRRHGRLALAILCGGCIALGGVRVAVVLVSAAPSDDTGFQFSDAF